MDDELELSPLVAGGERVCRLGAGEAALRAQSEALERNEMTRVFDSANQLVLGLEHRSLGAYESMERRNSPSVIDSSPTRS